MSASILRVHIARILCICRDGAIGLARGRWTRIPRGASGEILTAARWAVPCPGRCGRLAGDNSSARARGQGEAVRYTPASPTHCSETPWRGLKTGSVSHLPESSSLMVGRRIKEKKRRERNTLQFMWPLIPIGLTAFGCPPQLRWPSSRPRQTSPVVCLQLHPSFFSSFLTIHKICGHIKL